MDAQPPLVKPTAENPASWMADRHPTQCEQCGRTFLSYPDGEGITCPLCQLGKLEHHPGYTLQIQPELILPFKISPQKLPSIYKNFISPVWIKPKTMNVEMLLENTRAVFWPHWLVNSDVKGSWLMEAGFDYEVESAKESFSGIEWRSQKKILTRVRWEDRLGQLSTHIDNVITPALKEHKNRLQMTGEYHLDKGEDFLPNKIGSAILELPDVPPEAAWLSALPTFEKKVAETCKKAADAQHFRNFTADVNFHNEAWAEFFLPMYTTYYKTDEGSPQVLVINGETGAIQGPLLASPEQGGFSAGIVAGIAGGLFLFMLIGFLLALRIPEIRCIASSLGFLSFIGVIIAFVVNGWPKLWNQRQTGPQIFNNNK